MTQLTDVSRDEIDLQPSDDGEHFVMFRGAKLGFVDRYNEGYVFHPYVDFDNDEPDVLEADDLDEMRDRLFDEIDRCLEIIESRRESGWYANL